MVKSITHCRQWNYTATSVKYTHTHRVTKVPSCYRHIGKPRRNNTLNRFKSSGTLCCINWQSHHHSVGLSVILGQTFQFHQNISNYYQSTQHNNPGGLNLQQCQYKNLKPHRLQYSPYSSHARTTIKGTLDRMPKHTFLYKKLSYLVVAI